MKNNSRVPENLIYKIWAEKRISPDLKTSDGLELEIIDPGIINTDLAGPDFHNARIRIGNITYSGDVEIDNFHSDWRLHGHHLNQKYNKLILHTVLSANSNQTFVVTQSGRKVHTLELEKFLEDPIKETLLTEIANANSNDVKMTCKEVNYLVNNDLKLNFIKQLGLLRFRKKCKRYLDRLKEILVINELQLKEPIINHDFHEQVNKRNFTTDEFQSEKIWQQLLYEEIFEALGYSKNKDIMIKLSRAVELDFFKKIPVETYPLSIESALFFVSGLIPETQDLGDEETTTYVRKLYEYWAENKGKYDGQFFQKQNWNFYKLRPQNFPTVRLSAGSKLLEKIIVHNLFDQLLKTIVNMQENNKIVSKLRDLMIVKGFGYWASHYNFNKKIRSNIKYFIGVGRADETIVNIILPFLSVYFEVFDKKRYSERVLEIYLNYHQKEGNHLVDEVSETLNIADEKLRSVYYQGMIELFRNYCIKQKCTECEIGKYAFN